MRFTLISTSTAIIMTLAGASAFFIPAFIAVGIAIDSNNRKTVQPKIIDADAGKELRTGGDCTDRIGVRYAAWLSY